MRIVCVGLATVDLVYRVGRIPGPDEKAQADGFDVAAGGPALNAAVTAAALGASAVLVSAVGAHPLGALIREDLRRYGVGLLDATPDATAPPPVSSVAVLAGTGQRTVVSRNAGDLVVAVPPGLDRLVTRADAVLVDGHHPELARAATRAAAASPPTPDATAGSPTPDATAGSPTRDATAGYPARAATAGFSAFSARGGPPVVADAGTWRPVFADLLPGCAVVACGDGFRDPAATGAGDDATAAALRARGVPHVAITHGPEPVRWWSTGTGTGTGTAGAVPVPPVAAVDTAGAGDTFHGALAVAVARDPDVTDLAQALRYAIRVAGIRVAHAGPRSWLDDPRLATLRLP